MSAVEGRQDVAVAGEAPDSGVDPAVLRGLVERLQAIVGEEHVYVQEHQLRTYESDGLLQYKVRAGAVVLPGTDRLDKREAVAVAGEAICWVVAVDCEAPGTARIASPIRRAEAAGLEEWTMSTHQPDPPDPDEDASLDDLPVRLGLAVVRVELPVAALGGMGPGFVLPRAPNLGGGAGASLGKGRPNGRG